MIIATGVWCARVAHGELLAVKPERDLQISNVSLGPDIQNGRSTFQIHFKTVEWDDTAVKSVSKPDIPKLSRAILCVLSPGQNEHVAINIVLERGEEYVFEVSGTNDIYVAGNYIERNQSAPVLPAENLPLLFKNLPPVEKPQERAQPIIDFATGEIFQGFRPPKLKPKTKKPVMDLRTSNESSTSRKRKSFDSPQIPPSLESGASTSIPRATTTSRAVTPQAMRGDTTGLPSAKKVKHSQTPLIQPKKPSQLSNLPTAAASPTLPMPIEPKTTHKPSTGKELASKTMERQKKVKPSQILLGQPKKPVQHSNFPTVTAPPTLPVTVPIEPKTTHKPSTGKELASETVECQPTDGPNSNQGLEAPIKTLKTSPEFPKALSGITAPLKEKIKSPPTSQPHKTPTASSSKSMKKGITHQTTVAATSHTTKTPAAGGEEPTLTLETNRVIFAEVDVGQGHLIQDSHNITMWYICKIVETGDVYQRTTMAGGPTTTFVMGRGSFPNAIEHGMRGMRVGGTRAVILPSALADIDENWKDYLTAMNIPENSTIHFQCKVLGSTPEAVHNSALQSMSQFQGEPSSPS